VSYVVRDQRASKYHGMRGDQDIKISNWRSSLRKYATDPSELGRSDFVEGHYFDG
jgi:hypothetical protein